MKEKLNKDMENLRKKNETQILEIKSLFSQMKNTVVGQSSRLEQVEDRLSEVKDNIEIKEKTEEFLVKQFKNSKRNMQELRNSIKRPNLRIMGIKGEELKANMICSVFHNIVTESFPNLETDLPIQV
jgi:chromosome segregation ATPase